MTLYAKFAYSTETCNNLVNHIYNFEHINSEQKFTALCPGKYKLETWGAKGGNTTYVENSNEGGYGTYAVGEVNLNKNQKLYIN